MGMQTISSLGQATEDQPKARSVAKVAAILCPTSRARTGKAAPKAASRAPSSTAAKAQATTVTRARSFRKTAVRTKQQAA